MKKYITKFVSKKTVATGTEEFLFEKPEGFSYVGGNSLDWTFLNPPETDDEGNTRSFTIVTAPYEEYIGFATRMRDTAFKRSLTKLNPGDELQCEGPWEDFVLNADTSKTSVFLVGGIGITPFYSMIKENTWEKSSRKLILLYSDKTPQDMAFLEDLKNLEKENPNFKFIPVMTRVQPNEWNGETGHITFDLVKKYVPDISNSIFYSAGPEKMVAAMKQLLLDAGIQEFSIKVEEFPGY